jgi:CRISPR-associated protein Csy1
MTVEMTNKDTVVALAKKIEEYLATRRDKKHEDYLKSKPKKNKQGEVSAGIMIRLLATTKRLTNKSEEIKAIENSKKSKEQTTVEYQIQKYNLLMELIGENPLDNELSALKSEYLQFVNELNFQHQPINWLNEWTDKAKDISFATHVAKLTHSSSKGTSILDSSQSKDSHYLTTSCLVEPEIDTASANAASLPIADVLKIEHDGYSILDCVKSGDGAVFTTFTNEEAQIDRWMEALKQAYDNDTKQSYFLSKQVYFPIADNEYHLLLPLTSSSLAQAIHEEHQIYFDKEQTKAREQQREGKYSATTVVRYPQKAKLNITGSNHSNASSLNGKRGGKITLFVAQPPQWKQQPKSFGHADDEDFLKHLVFVLQDDINELHDYLKLLKNKKLSDSKPVRANAIHRKVEAISHTLFDTVILINQNETENWTISSQLSLPYQLLFEPYRDDESAKAEKVTKEWLSIVSKSFGIFLNKQLNRKSKLNLTPIHSELWAKIFAEYLRIDIATREVSL